MNRLLIFLAGITIILSCGNDADPCPDFISLSDVELVQDYGCADIDGEERYAFLLNVVMDRQLKEDLNLEFEWTVLGQKYVGHRIVIPASEETEATLRIYNSGCEIATVIQLDKESDELYPKGILGNTVWLDNREWANYKSFDCLDASDSRIEGMVVQLINPEDRSIIDQVITDEEGRYIFFGLEEGEYQLRFVNEDSNLEFVKPFDCDDTYLDSHCDRDGYTDIFYLNECEINLTIDAGLKEY
jgi:hypothetical protein